MIEIRGDNGSITKLNDDAGKAINKAFDKSLHHPNVVIVIRNGKWECLDQADIPKVMQEITG